eukprot:5808093-Pyramimonas_sp.AAC.1
MLGAPRWILGAPMWILGAPTRMFQARLDAAEAEKAGEETSAPNYGHSFVRCSWLLEAALALPTPAELTSLRRPNASNGYPEYLWVTDKVQKLLRTLAGMSATCRKDSR